MHEVGLMTAALDQAIRVAAQAGAGGIQRLTFAVPAGGQMPPENVATLFHMVSRGTIAAGADVIVEVREREWYCWECEQTHVGGDAVATCPACGAPCQPAGAMPDMALLSIEVFISD